ncbi:OLC1v1002979C1 [Oldenlandia corymbosa var. corymbosa]|uniref:OLC1v1002979C1 n=1 Tax=Oldenlandia corymbosa var. corymbosa TaxID=529605 RepID=A0AAV1DAN6_OLDCO|nr:OLC1v1002979C1 [Oldenlandia corymbosa var. corymbosa]
MDVVQNSRVSAGSLSAKQPALEVENGFVSGNHPCESTKISDYESSLPNKPSDCLRNVETEPLLQKQDGDYPTKTGILSSELTNLQESGQVLVSPGESDSAKHVHQNAETAQNNLMNTGGEPMLEDKTPVKSRKRRSSSALPASNRVLRSRSQEKAKDCEPNEEVIEEGATGTTRRKRRKKKVTRKMPVDQFASIKTHLRYLLHRINYEQNLIDAYAGEGWKGQSLEKIKPEKELQRAKSQIFRYKLKIRDLFQRIDTSLAEGKLPETLFDDDGQIDSEDIFCAKCGSKDLTLDNDIILCDGACERGFHQFCLEPPLLKDDIPPGDEGWLCPGCDCKVDCMEMLSDFQGSTFSLLDNWEKVFPEEAAAALSGTKMDDYSGLPSDDSEDDDYDPDKQEQDQMVSAEESSSDDSAGSDYFSADDDNVPARDDKQILGLPSDDSEDDDFDPTAPDLSDHSKQENSGSDFTSDSEGEDVGSILNEDDQNNSPVTGSVGEEVKLGRAKRKSLSDEVAYLLQSSDAPKSARRHVERLDYKKLHQETYGDTSSDSSDEDYGETTGMKRGKRSGGKGSVPQRKNDSVGSIERNYSQEECEKNLIEKSKIEETGSLNGSAEQERTDDGGSNSKSSSRKYKRLEESVVQRLHESFKENQYPKLDVKESLAQELGISLRQVSKWFENARWSSRHSARMESKMVGTNGTSSPENSGKIAQLGQKSLTEGACNGPEKIPPSHSAPNKEEGQSAGVAETKSSTSLNSRKKRGDKSGHDSAYKLPSTERTPEPELHGDTSKSRAVRRSGRLQTKTSS